MRRNKAVVLWLLRNPFVVALLVGALIFNLVILHVQEVRAAPLSEELAFGSQISSLSGLTEKEKMDAVKVYEALKNITPASEKMVIPIYGGYTFTTATSNATVKELEEPSLYVQRVTQTAIDAFMRDYPEVFWIDISGSNWIFYYNYSYQGGSYLNRLTQLEYEIKVSDVYDPPATYNANLKNAIMYFPISGETRYEKLLYIHNELCRRNTYGEGTYAHQAYGALKGGNIVCEGYAEAFKLLCDREKIPCLLVSGNSVDSTGATGFHMWNYVQMEDGKWYAVDVTWDDGRYATYQDYFLVGSTTVAKNFDNRTFSNSHRPKGDFNLVGITAFKYPTLSTKAYDKDAVIPTSTPQPTPLPARLLLGDELYGDVDNNKLVEAEDALIVLQAIVKLTTLTEEQGIRGDVDSDWKMTAKDSLFILKRVVKQIQQFPVEAFIEEGYVYQQ